MKFSQEFSGYNKEEVDAYVNHMKADYESKLMEEKLKTLESERRLLNLKNEHLKLEHKEKSIMDALNVLEKAKKFQEEGTKSFYSLVFDKIEVLIQELTLRFPNLRKNNEFNNIVEELNEMIVSFKNKEQDSPITNPINSSNDSMRLLLNKMQEYKKVQDPKEFHITTIKPTENLEESSGFNLEEALNPTEDLEEIMKAFDFYNSEN